MAKFIKLFGVTGLGILLLCSISCDQKQKPVKKEKQIMVVSKSIDLSKKTNAGNQNLKPAKPAIKKKPSMPGGPSSLPDKRKDSLSAKGVSSDLSGSVTEDKAKQELTMANVALTGSALDKKTYDKKGRVDPFIPLLSEKKEEVPAPKSEETNKPKRILTPLEKMDLNQIRLVAIIEMTGRSIAMVEEASGKGYEVKLGTYIGRNGGQVSEINENGIVVKDYVKDFKGIRRERLQEIKFHKTEGGE